jgi:protein-S-isoprenylcysteine O-methyltransferase Ste14
LITQNLDIYKSNRQEIMLNRLKRWILVSGGVVGLIFALAGTWRDPWLWGYASVWSAAAFYALFTIDEDLARERFHPPVAGADSLALHVMRIMAISHLAVGALDSGRWHLTGPVPPAVRALALAAMATMFALFFGAMCTNRFFSSVVRIQSDRGHRVVDRGLYAVVRHPGYAGLMLGMPFSGLALGSWIAGGMGLVMSALILRRVMFEDAFLQKNLDGYTEYAQRVRHRVVPGLW